MTGIQVGQIPSECRQLIVVHTPTYDDDTGKLYTYYRDSASDDPTAGWKQKVPPITAHLGEQGSGTGTDDTKETPVGSFPLTRAFGKYAQITSAMPYFQAGPTWYWDEDWHYWLDSVARGDKTEYNLPFQSNIHPPQFQLPNGKKVTREAEQLTGPCYELAILIDHNPTRRPGWGCAVFLHVVDPQYKPTWGCISIDSAAMKAIAQWLRPDHTPYLTVIVDHPS